MNLMNMNKWVLSLAVSSMFNTKSTSKISKLKYIFLKNQIESSFYCGLAWLEIVTPGIRKCKFCVQLYIDIWKIILYLQANPYWLKTKNINSLIFISSIMK